MQLKVERVDLNPLVGEASILKRLGVKSLHLSGDELWADGIPLHESA